MNNATIDYINSLPVPGSTKWFLGMMCAFERRIFTQQLLANKTGYSRRMVRHHLYELIRVGAVSRRDNHKYGKKTITGFPITASSLT